MEMPHNLNELIQYGFYAIASFIGAYGVGVLAAMKKSIDALNLQVGILIERTTWHDREIQRLDRIKANKEKMDD